MRDFSGMRRDCGDMAVIRSLHRAGMVEEMRARIQTSALRSPRSFYLHELRMLEATVLAERGDTQEAESILTSLCAQLRANVRSRSSARLLLIQVSLEQRSQFADAVVEYERLLGDLSSTRPSLADVHDRVSVRLGACLVRIGKEDRAVQVLSAVITRSLGASRLEALLWLARLHAASATVLNGSGDFDRAEEQYWRAVRLFDAGLSMEYSVNDSSGAIVSIAMERAVSLTRLERIARTARVAELAQSARVDVDRRIVGDRARQKWFKDQLSIDLAQAGR